MVEDNEIYRELIVSALGRFGHEAIGVGDGHALYRELIRGPADVIVLDVDLPGESGLEIAQQLRAVPGMRQMGIIMVTGHNRPQDRVAGLSNGADVYIGKPLNLDELDAYVRSLHRRLQPEDADQDTRPWRFRTSEWTLIAPNGAEIELTHLEASLITVLGQAPARPVRRRDIISKAFGSNPMEYDERRLEAIVSRLRRKIHKHYPLTQPLKVAHAVGYLFSEPMILE